MEDKNTFGSERRAKGGSWTVPARYSFAAVSMVGMFCTLMALAFPPVVIPAMVRRNSSATPANLTVDVCFFGAAGQAASASEETGDFDWSEVTQSFVMVANSVGLAPSMVVAGRLVEVWSPKYLTMGSSLVAVLVTALIPLTARAGVGTVIASQFVAGLLMGAPLPALNTMISSWFPPEERQKMTGIMLSAMNLGIVAANSLTGKLVDSLGWRPAFYIMPCPLLAWILLWWFCVYDTPNTHPRISEEELAYILANNNKDQTQTKGRFPWRELLTSSPVWAHVSMALAPSWILNTYVNSLPTYMMDALHYSATQAGYLLAIPQFFFWVSVIAFGFIAQWVREKKYIGHLMSNNIFNAISTLGSAACLIALAQVGCNEVAVLIFLMGALFCSGAYMGGSKLNHMDLAVNYAGTLAGLQAAFDITGSIVAPTVNGIVTNNQQTLTAWSHVFYITAGVNVFFFFVYLIFGSVDEQPWNRTVDDDNKNQEDISQASTVDVVELCK